MFVSHPATTVQFSGSTHAELSMIVPNISDLIADQLLLKLEHSVIPCQIPL